MKSLSHYLLMAAMCLIVSTSFNAEGATFVFKAQDAVSEGSEIMLPDSSHLIELKLPISDGVTIGEKPEAVNDEKSLVFSGLQRQAFVSIEPIQNAATGFKIEASFMVSSGAPALEHAGTLFRHGNWEIRCDPMKKSMTIIVWHENTNPSDKVSSYTTLSVPIQIGVWQKLVATLESNVLSFDVGGVSATQEILNPIASENPSFRLVIGAAARTAESFAVESFRPFCGKLADMQFTLE